MHASSYRKSRVQMAAPRAYSAFERHQDRRTRHRTLGRNVPAVTTARSMPIANVEPGHAAANRDSEDWDQESARVTKLLAPVSTSKLGLDINECEEKLDDCHPTATCRNFVGGYACICDTGYRKSVDGVCEGLPCQFSALLIYCFRHQRVSGAERNAVPC